MTRIQQVRKRLSPSLTLFTILTVLLMGTLIVTPTTNVKAVNDQWEITCSDSPSGSNNYLFGVAAQANDAVVAVGSKNVSGTYKPLTERWEQPSPSDPPCFKEKSNPSVTLNSELLGVARVPSGATDLRPFWAVGYQGATSRAAWDGDAGDWILGSASQTLIEYSANGGQTWSIVSSPNLTGTNILKGVAARSDDDAWAVGYYGNSGDLRTLILHWNGTSWSVVPSPNQNGAYNNYLHSVSIVAKDDVWAVGFTDHPYYDPPTHRNLILHWNGTNWSEVTAPQPSNAWNYLFSATGIASYQAHAVGSYLPNGSGSKDTQALVWNGSNWSWEQSPSPGSGADVFYGSAPVTSSYLWAVGSYEDPQPQRTLTARRVNGVWYQVSSPNASTSHNYLRGVTVVPGTSPCAGGNNWAVGYYVDGGVVNTLTMRYYITPGCDLIP
jgi:hypothetical protein